MIEKKEQNLNWMFLLHLSFIIYPYLFFCAVAFFDYIYGKAYFKIIVLLSYIIFTIGVLYQIIFLFKLRKNYPISFLRCIFLYLVRVSQYFSILGIIYMLKTFIFGYDVYTFLFPTYVKTVFGIEAWAEDLGVLLIILPCLIITAILTLIDWAIKKHLAK